MDVEKQSSRWKVVGRTVRGASHERSGTPNQDAISWLPESGNSSSMVLAVSDGHGGTKYSRSHVGASLAVEIATQSIYKFLGGQSDVDNLSLTKRAAEEWLPKTLVRTWCSAVAEHIKDHPLSDSEFFALTGNNGVAPEILDEKLRVAYGATMLAVAVTESFILYLQLGDGEILNVSSRGEVSRPLAKDDRLFANETTSLCTQDAWRDFRVSFQPITHAIPALVLISTDGYPNSFRDEAGFLRVGSDILKMIRTQGLEKVDEGLQGWLTDSTQAGSGDDVTVGILCSINTGHKKTKRRTTR